MGLCAIAIPDNAFLAVSWGEEAATEEDVHNLAVFPIESVTAGSNTLSV